MNEQVPRPHTTNQDISKEEDDNEGYNNPEMPARKRDNFTESVANTVKSALGGGILSGHVAYMKAGIAVGIPMNFFTGAFIAYSLHLLVLSMKILYTRAGVPKMSYPDVGETAMALFPSRKIRRLSKLFRYLIEFVICIYLFGACVGHQLIIAKSIKQLVEDTLAQTVEGIPGYPSLRVYIICMIPFLIFISSTKHVKNLGPCSVFATMCIILFCMFTSTYYALLYNPTLKSLTIVGEPVMIVQAIGMIAFAMTCGVVLPIENHMKHPDDFPAVVAIAMSIVTFFTFMVSFTGHIAYLDRADSPITLNFPMGIWQKVLKVSIAIMIYVTHGLCFRTPFDMCFTYMRTRISEQDEEYWELISRAMLVTLIGVVAILFPDIPSLLSFIGTFCLSNIAFIWPNLVYLLVIYERPGLGKFRWRLWRGVFLIMIGASLLIAGSLVTLSELIELFFKEKMW